MESRQMVRVYIYYVSALSNHPRAHLCQRHICHMCSLLACPFTYPEPEDAASQLPLAPPAAATRSKPRRKKPRHAGTTPVYSKQGAGGQRLGEHRVAREDEIAAAAATALEESASDSDSDGVDEAGSVDSSDSESAARLGGGARGSKASARKSREAEEMAEEEEEEEEEEDDSADADDEETAAAMSSDDATTSDDNMVGLKKDDDDDDDDDDDSDAEVEAEDAPGGAGAGAVEPAVVLTVDKGQSS